MIASFLNQQQPMWTVQEHLAREERINALVDFAEAEASCPCCEGIYECAEGCTIEEDSKQFATSWERYERMLRAREALNTGSGK